MTLSKEASGSLIHFQVMSLLACYVLTETLYGIGLRGAVYPVVVVSHL